MLPGLDLSEFLFGNIMSGDDLMRVANTVASRKDNWNSLL